MIKVIISIMFLLVSVTFAQNAILNPSFEEARGDTPSYWYTGSADGQNPPNTTFVWEENISHTGERCVSIERDGEETGGYWRQTVLDFETGKPLLFATFAMSDQEDIDFGITVVFWLDGRPIMPPVVIEGQADEEWSRTAGTFSVPMYTDSVRIQLTFYQASGKIYFDDASLVIYEEDGISDNPDVILTPEHLTLFPAYPNPFNPKVEIAFGLNRSGSARFSVFDVNGTLLHESSRDGLETGFHRFEWDGSDHLAGNYFFTIEQGGRSLTTKAVLIK